MEQAVSALRKLGASGSVVLGDPNDDGRHGFKAEPSLVLPGVTPEYVRIMVLGEPPAAQAVFYHASFEAQA